MAQPGSSRHVLANHYIPADFDGTQNDRRGGLPGGSAGNAQQYDNWARGGIGRFSLAGALGIRLYSRSPPCSGVLRGGIGGLTGGRRRRCLVQSRRLRAMSARPPSTSGCCETYVLSA
jgi:hypothetical protein